MSKPDDAQDKLISVFEKMIDDFCDTHSSEQVEAVLARTQELFARIERRAASPSATVPPCPKCGAQPDAQEKP